MAVTLKIMSFNSRCEVEKDGANYFWNRTDRILEMIERESPDIIGFQEITRRMQAWYVEKLDAYTLIGVGRGKNYTDEGTVIAFKKGKMDLISADSVMLSSTPKIPGSRYYGTDQSACPRIYTKVFLKHRELDAPFWVYNIHTDHAGAIARQMACMQVLQDISMQEAPVLLTGDFNATPEKPEIQLLQSSKNRPLVDTTSEIEGTFHNFGRFPRLEKIDYIFADARLRVLESAAIEDPGVDGVYLSDHLPIYTVISMENEHD